VIDDHALGVKRMSDAPVAVAWEPGTQRPTRSRRAFFSALGGAAVIVSRTRQLHDTASPSDGDGFGPLTME
jgi:hypothetical protein